MFPEINRIRKTNTYISVFRGLNRTPNSGFSRVGSHTSAVFTEFTDMQNLCGDDYPQLRTRKKRCAVDLAAISDTAVTSNLLAFDNQLIYTTNDNRLHVGAASYPIEPTGAYTEHTLTLYGNRVIMLPDRRVFDLGTHGWFEMDFSNGTDGVDGNQLNDATFNGGNYARETKHFKDFSIEKVALDDNGAPLPVDYIYEKATELENYSKQTNPSQHSTIDMDDYIDPWQGEYYLHWKTVAIGETVEAQGEEISGVYKCTDILEYTSEGKRTVINGVEYNTNAPLRRFVRINNPYVKISRHQQGGGAQFVGLKAGDFVKISGMEHRVATLTTGLKAWERTDWGNYIRVLNGNTFKVYYADDNCFVIKANIDRSVPYTGPMTVSRVMPPTDSGLLLEVNNRLWACSSQNNEVYSCKQGDPTNWQAYGDGISTDSYAATVGCEGHFTGIARQNDSVIFFKENWILKLFGTKPGNYTLASYNVTGVARGSEKSVVWINGVLYYLSPVGVCQYTPGGQPVVVSDRVFGNRRYQNGVAGRHKSAYYLSAQNEGDTWELFVLDTLTGLWHKQDDTHMRDCVTYNDLLYYVDDDEDTLVCAEQDNNLLLTYGADTEEAFDWMLETADLYADDFGKKYISKIQIALHAADDMEAVVYAQFRRDGAWRELRKLRPLEREHSLIHVPVRRSDFLKLRIEGTGEMRISGIQIDFAKGTEKTWQY